MRWIEYFKKIERNANSFMDKVIQTVLKEQEDLAIFDWMLSSIEWISGDYEHVVLVGGRNVEWIEATFNSSRNDDYLHRYIYFYTYGKSGKANWKPDG